MVIFHDTGFKRGKAVDDGRQKVPKKWTPQGEMKLNV
jgi:hypothetical protein